MTTKIQQLIDTLSEADYNTQVELFTKTSLEGIAHETDNVIMHNLMLDMIQKNAALNKELSIKLEEIRLLSVTDQLTGLFNRRKFAEVLIGEFGRLKRYKHAFTIIMFDIDHFKNVNDTYGHDIGDFVLTELSNVVTSNLRHSDTIARWGGEEFMILAPETTKQVGEQLAEKIRFVLEQHDFSPVPELTCSFGVIHCQDESMANIALLTKLVDEALYKAKESGRNRVVSA